MGIISFITSKAALKVKNKLHAHLQSDSDPPTPQLSPHLPPPDGAAAPAAPHVPLPGDPIVAAPSGDIGSAARRFVHVKQHSHSDISRIGLAITRHRNLSMSSMTSSEYGNRAAHRRRFYETTSAAATGSLPVLPSGLARQTTDSVHTPAHPTPQRPRRRGFVDLIEAQSEIVPLDGHSRIVATGARAYGEDVAERNLAQNGINLDAPQVRAFYAAMHSHARRPSTTTTSSTGRRILRIPTPILDHLQRPHLTSRMSRSFSLGDPISNFSSTFVPNTPLAPPPPLPRTSPESVQQDCRRPISTYVPNPGASYALHSTPPPPVSPPLTHATALTPARSCRAASHSRPTTPNHVTPPKFVIDPDLSPLGRPPRLVTPPNTCSTVAYATLTPSSSRRDSSPHAPQASPSPRPKSAVPPRHSFHTFRLSFTSTVSEANDTLLDAAPAPSLVLSAHDPDPTPLAIEPEPVLLGLSPSRTSTTTTIPTKPGPSISGVQHDRKIASSDHAFSPAHDLRPPLLPPSPGAQSSHTASRDNDTQCRLDDLRDGATSLHQWSLASSASTLSTPSLPSIPSLPARPTAHPLSHLHSRSSSHISRPSTSFSNKSSPFKKMSSRRLSWFSSREKSVPTLPYKCETVADSYASEGESVIGVSRGPGEEDLLFSDSGYGHSGLELPGLYGALDVAVRPSPPPSPPRPPIHHQYSSHVTLPSLPSRPIAPGSHFPHTWSAASPVSARHHIHLGYHDDDKEDYSDSNSGTTTTPPPIRSHRALPSQDDRVRFTSTVNNNNNIVDFDDVDDDEDDILQELDRLGLPFLQNLVCTPLKPSPASSTRAPKKSTTLGTIHETVARISGLFAEPNTVMADHSCLKGPIPPETTRDDAPRIPNCTISSTVVVADLE